MAGGVGLRRKLRLRVVTGGDAAHVTAHLKDDVLLRPALERWRGMRVTSAASLYKFLVLAIVLQNATVRRSVNMLQALFERDGVRGVSTTES